MQAFGLARLGRTAELRYTPEGTAVVNLSLAFNYGRKADDGQRPTQWVDGALWGKLAEVLAEYLMVGTRVMVSMSDVHTETYKTQANVTGTKLVGRIDHIELAGSAPTAAPTPIGNVPPPQRPATTPRPPAQKPSGTFADMDDDIPF